MHYKTGYVEVNGAQIRYERAGEGPTVILLHAGLVDRHMWLSQFEVFKTYYDVVCYDARGFGATTSANDVTYSHCGDLLGVMDALKIQRAALVGLSLGGKTAIDFTVENPTRVSALVPVCAALSGFQLNSEVLKGFRAQFEAAQNRGDVAAQIEILLRVWVDGPERTPDHVPADVRYQVQVMHVQLKAKQAREGQVSPPQEIDPPAFQRLAGITAPTLIIQGDMDMPDVLAVSELLEQHIPFARKVMVPHAAHMVSLEYPALFNRLVLDFLREHLDNR
ncbi:MAG: alpha/beta hydrolase [Chloroflexi bacterium]|nr:alpha/beta hydrolase [Chloroflexota bacterium]